MTGEQTMPICCLKCGWGIFSTTYLVTYEELREIYFYPEGQIEQSIDKDCEKDSEKQMTPYRCSKCGWILADDQGRPLMQEKEIMQWVEQHKRELDIAAGCDDA
jgi:predicted RNA-binding Zn-ribbon protein involved in translation (DUF1610 family)